MDFRLDAIRLNSQPVKPAIVRSRAHMFEQTAQPEWGLNFCHSYVVLLFFRGFSPSLLCCCAVWSVALDCFKFCSFFSFGNKNNRWKISLMLMEYFDLFLSHPSPIRNVYQAALNVLIRSVDARISFYIFNQCHWSNGMKWLHNVCSSDNSLKKFETCPQLREHHLQINFKRIITTNSKKFKFRSYRPHWVPHIT